MCCCLCLEPVLGGCVQDDCWRLPHVSCVCVSSPPVHWCFLQVGNAAFAGEYNAWVPDTWGLINALDPVPWVPKVGLVGVAYAAAAAMRGGFRVVISPAEMPGRLIGACAALLCCTMPWRARSGASSASASG